MSDPVYHVLVVEDDPLVRMAAVDMVATLGFTPVQAADATEALNILSGKGRVDILFTDIGLPGMRGHGYIHDLLAETTRFHAARGEPRITATTDTTNQPMAAAFRRASYQETGIRYVFSAPAGQPG